LPLAILRRLGRVATCAQLPQWQQNCSKTCQVSNRIDGERSRDDEQQWPWRDSFVLPMVSLIFVWLSILADPILF